MSRLIGTSGEVLSIEIESALIENSHKALDNLGIRNVSLLLGDGSRPPSDAEEFDRGIFTASSWNLPEVFFDLIRDSGLLLFVLKIHESRTSFWLSGRAAITSSASGRFIAGSCL